MKKLLDEIYEHLLAFQYANICSYLSSGSPEKI